MTVIATNATVSNRRSVFAMIKRAIGTVYEWQRRASERHHLADIDDRLLADIGRTRAEISFEANKPFYKA